MSYQLLKIGIYIYIYINIPLRVAHFWRKVVFHPPIGRAYAEMIVG